MIDYWKAWLCHYGNCGVNITLLCLDDRQAGLAMDDYLSYFEDFEQESGSKHSGSDHSVNIESDTVLREPKEAKKVKKTKKPAMPVVSSPRDRLLSSKDHELRTLQNKLSATRKELQDTERENKTLRRLQIRQEKELTKLTSKEGELPMILERHNREVRSLREQLKRSQKTNKELTKKQSDLSDELWRANERKKDLEALSKRKDLKEREHLMMELQDVVEASKKKGYRILELEKGVELMNKTHTQEVKSLMAKNRLLTSQLANTEQEMIRFRQQLKEKERLLEVTNIYSQRVPHSSLLPPPLPVMEDTSTQTILTQPSKNRNKEMIFKVKCDTNTVECQTEGGVAAIIKKFSTKQLSKSVSSDDNTEVTGKYPPPPPPTQPVAMTTVTSQPKPLGEDSQVPVPVSVVQATPTPALPEPLKLPTRPSLKRPHPTSSPTTMATDDRPLMDISSSPSATPTIPMTTPTALSIGPPAKPTPTISPLAKPPATPTSSKTVQQSPDKTSNIHQILFGTTGATPTNTQQAIPTQNESTKAQMDRKQKDELMKKLFPQKYNMETTKEETKEQTNDVQQPLEEDSVGRRPRHRNDNTSRRTTEVFGTSSITDDNSKDSVKPSHGVNGIVSHSEIGSVFGTSSITDSDGGEPVVKQKPLRVNGVVNHHNERTGIGSEQRANSNNSNLLNQLFNTDESLSRGTTEKKDDKIIKDSSSTSLLSQSERVKNMHRGLPSMASGDDPYGTRQQRTSSGNNQGTVKHGRRAVPATVKSSTSTGMMFGEQNLSNAIFGESGNTIFGNSNGPVGRSSPLDDSSKVTGGSYPWETKVNIHSNTGATTGRVNNSNSRIFDEEIDEITI